MDKGYSPDYEHHNCDILAFVENRLHKIFCRALFADTPNIFDFPKPTRLLKRMVSIAAKNDDIILDFFSGSATTAHAVMQLNAEDGGNRRFILVQLPELCDEKSEAYKAGYGL